MAAWCTPCNATDQRFCAAGVFPLQFTDVCQSFYGNLVQGLSVGHNSIVRDILLTVGQQYVIGAGLRAYGYGGNEAERYSTGNGLGATEALATALNSAHSYFEILDTGASLVFESGNNYLMPPDANPNVVPEPGSLTLMLLALGSLAHTRKR